MCVCVCVSVFEVDMCCGVSAFYSLLCRSSVEPLDFQGVHMKTAIVPACICINYCLFSLRMYVIVLSSRCLFFCSLTADGTSSRKNN